MPLVQIIQSTGTIGKRATPVRTGYVLQGDELSAFNSFRDQKLFQRLFGGGAVGHLDFSPLHTVQAGDKVRYLNVAGEAIPKDDFDLVLSIDVLHHIPDPRPVVQAAYEALRPGGRMLAWVYGHEGSRAYQSIFMPVRMLTRNLPVAINEVLAWTLYPFVLGYGTLTRLLPSLPLSNYLSNVYLRFPPAERRLVILDQINPRWAKYYTREEA